MPVRGRPGREVDGIPPRDKIAGEYQEGAEFLRPRRSVSFSLVDGGKMEGRELTHIELFSYWIPVRDTEEGMRATTEGSDDGMRKVGGSRHKWLWALIWLHLSDCLTHKICFR